MAVRVVGIGGLDASKSPEDTLVTYALGSCVALILYEPRIKLAGMAHIALPESSVSLAKATELPGYFADTGVPLLMRLLVKLGASPATSRIRAKLVGGSRIMDNDRVFDIGSRNIEAIRARLREHKIVSAAEDIGGVLSRTVSVRVADGRVEIQTSDMKKWEL